MTSVIEGKGRKRFDVEEVISASAVVAADATVAL
jgi:hypothetical protein